MYKVKTTFKTATLAFALMGFAYSAQAQHAEHDHSSHGSSGHVCSTEGEKSELRITPIMPSELVAGQSNEVVLFIQDERAKPMDVDAFEVVHTEPIHLLIIEEGLSDYHHKHPVQVGPGQYRFEFTPQTSNNYRIWVDVTPQGRGQHYYTADLKGSNNRPAPIQSVNILRAHADGYDFNLKIDGALHKGGMLMAELEIQKDGQPVDCLEPIMGAFAHMVGFYEDYASIAHIHPMGKEPKTDAERGGPVLSFHIDLLNAGSLKLFAQVQIEGKEVFAPFSFNIEE